MWCCGNRVGTVCGYRVNVHLGKGVSEMFELVREGWTGLLSLWWSGAGPAFALCRRLLLWLPFTAHHCFKHRLIFLPIEQPTPLTVLYLDSGGGVQLLSCVRLLVTHGLQHARLPCPSPSPGVCSNSWSLSRWFYLTISSSLVPFTSCPQSFPALESFPVSWLLTLGGQSIVASASTSVLPMNIPGWFPLGLTGLISFLSKGLSRVISRTTVRKHQFFSTQPSVWSNSHIHTGKTEDLTIRTLVSQVMPLIFNMLHSRGR